jgi:hypothetical protein
VAKPQDDGSWRSPTDATACRSDLSITLATLRCKIIRRRQERTRKNEGRIGEVDQKAAQAQSSADQANSAAGQARQEATAARSDANTKFDAIDKTNKRLVYEVVLSEDSGNFKFGKTLLPRKIVKSVNESKFEAHSSVSFTLPSNN